MAPIVKFVANKAMQKASEASQQSIALAFPSPDPFPGDSYSSNEAYKPPRDKTSLRRKKHICYLQTVTTIEPGHGDDPSKITTDRSPQEVMKGSRLQGYRRFNRFMLCLLTHSTTRRRRCTTAFFAIIGRWWRVRVSFQADWNNNEAMNVWLYR